MFFVRTIFLKETKQNDKTKIQKIKFYEFIHTKKGEQKYKFFNEKKHTLFDIPQSIRTSLDLDRLISETSKVSSAILVFFFLHHQRRNNRESIVVLVRFRSDRLSSFFFCIAQQTVVRACTNRARSLDSFAKFLRTLAVGHVVGFGVFFHFSSFG